MCIVPERTPGTALAPCPRYSAGWASAARSSGRGTGTRSSASAWRSSGPATYGPRAARRRCNPASAPGGTLSPVSCATRTPPAICAAATTAKDTAAGEAGDGACANRWGSFLAHRPGQNLPNEAQQGGCNACSSSLHGCVRRSACWSAACAARDGDGTRACR